MFDMLCSIRKINAQYKKCLALYINELPDINKIMEIKVFLQSNINCITGLYFSYDLKAKF